MLEYSTQAQGHGHGHMLCYLLPRLQAHENLSTYTYTLSCMMSECIDLNSRLFHQVSNLIEKYTYG